MIIIYFLSLLGQDGRIDYNEFATMMRKGDGGVGNRTMRGNLNFNLAEALGATDSTGVDEAIGTLKVAEASTENSESANNASNDSSKQVVDAASSDKLKNEDDAAAESPKN